MELLSQRVSSGILRETITGTLQCKVLRDNRFLQTQHASMPESYELDSALLARPGKDEIQLDLFLDYASNVALYPKFQEYFRIKQPSLLAVWGKNDPFFLPSGAEAFKRDNPNAEVHFYDTGHFALETHSAEIAAAIREFLDRKLVVKVHASDRTTTS